VVEDYDTKVFVPMLVKVYHFLNLGHTYALVKHLVGHTFALVKHLVMTQ